jgi:hypothetical protein
MAEKVIYDRQGVAKIFLLEGTFYDIEGLPLAFLYGDSSIVSYLGRHLGWFYNGYVRDLRGDAVGFADGARLGPVVPPVTGKPVRMPTSLSTPTARVAPREAQQMLVMSYVWSSDTLGHFFASGKWR